MSFSVIINRYSSIFDRNKKLVPSRKKRKKFVEKIRRFRNRENM